MTKDNAVYPTRAWVEINHSGTYLVWSSAPSKSGEIKCQYHGAFAYLWFAKRAAKRAMKRPVYFNDGVVYQIEN